MADIYVLLIRSSTIFSRFIHFVTKAEFTHAAISFDSECSKVYSFSRKYTNLPLPAGFVREGVQRGLMRRSKNAPYALFRVQISEENYEKLERRFDEMLSSGKFRYSLTGPFLCYFGIKRQKEYHYFCSQFVAEILQECGVIPEAKAPSLYQPVDFLNMKELELCDSGRLSQLQMKKIS